MRDTAHSAGSYGARRASKVLAFFNLAGAVVVAFVGMLANGIRCDDNCSITPGWRNNPDAWQWSAEFVLALVVFGSALLLNILIRRKERPHLAWLPVILQIGALAVIALLSATATTDPRASSSGLVWLFLFFGGTGALAAAVVGRETG